ncbi:uncharacterized protein LOC114528860 [Dendronephthya gigantea]|uniref:uncharacterized protein LOC114528860 n=1 Tax=Dendronephthya gigantea TaxID=151771 RepID=UPI00106CFFE8|nr:uncharacterized protein LOC114528860 [Dendronephthya gigantea]
MKVFLPFLVCALLAVFTTIIHGKDSASHEISNKESSSEKRAALRPVFRLYRSTLPAVWDNMYFAIHTKGKPSTLTRITDKDQIQQNRVDSGCTKYGWRPPGYNIDEYPFASSAQGGKGAVLREVPIRENSSQGGQLAQFYKKYDINHGDSYDIELIRDTDD